MTTKKLEYLIREMEDAFDMLPAEVHGGGSVELLRVVQRELDREHLMRTGRSAFDYPAASEDACATKVVA
jgi:hypothetical protein